MTKSTTKAKTTTTTKWIPSQSQANKRNPNEQRKPHDKPSLVSFSQKSKLGMFLVQLLTQPQTIAPRELMQSGGRDRTSPPLCKFFKSLRIAFFLFKNMQNACRKTPALDDSSSTFRSAEKSSKTCSAKMFCHLRNVRAVSVLIA